MKDITTHHHYELSNDMAGHFRVHVRLSIEDFSAD